MVEFEKNITSNESLKLFESVWQESIDGMRIIDENGIMILVNNAFCQLVDFSEEELTGKPMSVIYAESSKESILDHAKERIRTGTVIRRIERELTLHNGKKVWFELSNSEIKNDDGSKYILSIFRDISKQKLSQIKLEESEERFRKIFYESTDPLILYKHNGIIDCNDATLKILGLSEKKEILRKHPYDFSPEYQPCGKKSKDKGLEDIGHALEHGFNKFEWIHQKRDGTNFPVEVTLTKLILGGEEIFHIGWRDITHRKKAENDLKKFSDELRELNSTKDKFISIISHDLRGPFNGFLGISNMLANEIETLSQEEISLMGQELHKALKNQYQLLSELLEWSRLQTGRINHNPISINLPEKISEIIDYFNPTLNSKKINIKYDVDKAINITADEHLLNMLIRNLLTNAIKFTHVGGIIEFLADENFESISFSIKDNGVGIKEENLGLLFKLDKHISTEGTNGEKGTGLGLVLCNEIVQKHGGRIDVESRVGVGTTFSVTLPKQIVV